MTKTYHEAVRTLEELFDQFNEYLFNNEVEKPVIAILPDTTKGAYGWCTTQKIWKSENEEYYEINICAEHLDRPIKEVCATLIHEMVHLDNIKKGIKDTSANGRYHNKRFKDTAEAHGLIIEKVERYGWTKTSLKDETAAWIDENVKIEKFDLKRVKQEKTSRASKKKYNYYVCPCCGVKFYSIYAINAICEDCGETFMQYK